MRIVLLTCAAVGLFLGACTTPALNTIATSDVTTTDPGLVGTWMDTKDGDTTYVVTRQADDKAYRLTMIPDDGEKKSTELSFQVVKLAERTFVDMTVTAQTRKEMGETYGSTAIPAYVAMKFKRDGDSLTVWAVKQDWLISGLKDKKIDTPHTRVGDDDTYVLTGTSQELQAFYRKYVDNDSAWEDPFVLKRKK